MKIKQSVFTVPVLAFFFSLAACSFNKVEKSSGEAFLQGKWAEDSLATENNLVTYQRFHFKFICDSFYVVIDNFSKADLQGGPCYDKNTWKEYAKGNYKLVGDTLKFDGNFVDFEFKYKTQGSCYRSGKFTDNFLITGQKDSLVTLKSLESGTFHQLSLKERGSCK